MTRKRGNWDNNYPKVIAFLQKNGYEYVEYNDGQHLKVMGESFIIDLWPSKMTYHVVVGDEPTATNEWPRLDINFQESQLQNVLTYGKPKKPKGTKNYA